MSPALGDSDAYSVFDGDPARPGRAALTAPAPRRSRSGGRRPCGASATPPLTCTTAGPRPSIRRSQCTPARVPTSSRRYAELSPVASGTSRHSSVRSPRPRRSDDGELSTRQRLRGRPRRPTTARALLAVFLSVVTHLGSRMSWSVRPFLEEHCHAAASSEIHRAGVMVAATFALSLPGFDSQTCLGGGADPVADDLDCR